MSPTVVYEGRRRKMLATCEACWNDQTKRDCSGFVKAVCSALGLPDCAAPRSMQANELYGHFHSRKDLWYFLGSGDSAVSFAGVEAHEGNLVVAVWKDPAWEGPGDEEHRGHVAVVTEYFASRKSPKPTQLLLAYWGQWSKSGSAEGRKNEKVSLSFGTSKHSSISYFSYNSLPDLD